MSEPGPVCLQVYKQFEPRFTRLVQDSRTIYCNAHAQQNELLAMAETKKAVHDLLDFRANWREVFDHSYFRDLTSNQRQLRK